MADGLITYEDAVGLPPAPPPSAAPSSADTVDADYSARPLTVTRRAPSSPAALPGLITYEQATAPDTPHADGVLANATNDADSYTSGGLKGLGTTVIKGLSHIPGVFGDAMDLGDYLIARAQAKITGRPLADIQAEQMKERKSDWTDPRNYLPSGQNVSDPILSQTGEYKPISMPGKIAMGAGEAALGGIPFGGGAVAALSNAAAGGVGQGVTDITKDPLLGMVAGGIAAGGTHGALAAANKVASPAFMGIPGIDNVPIVGPRVAAARDNAAAARILSQSSDPPALREWAAQPAAPSDVPNSPQTLSGSVGYDRGLFQAEKDARNVDNLPFNAVDRAQSNAQQAAISGMQPDGDVFRPGQFIRQRLDAIDAAAQHAEDRLTAAHEAAATGRAQANQQAQDQLVQSFQDAHARATQAATDAAAPLQDVPPPEVTGATLRTAQQEATNAARQARNALYQAVDPDGTLATVVTPVKEAKQAISGAIDQHVGVQPSGAEAAIWSKIDRLPDVVPFRSLQELDTQVTAAMKAERQSPNPNDPQALPRLTQLKSAVMDAIHQGVENQAAHEARLVETGAMPAEDALQARLLQKWGLEDPRAAIASGAFARTGTGPSGFSGGRAYGRAGAIRAGDETPGQFHPASSHPRVSEAPRPNFDAAAAERLAAAKAAQSAYAQTYKNRTVSPVLDTNGFVGQYVLPNGAVPAKAIVAGAKGFDTANAFLAATANDPRAVAAMQDAVLGQLRPAVPPGGLLNLNALGAWKQRYAGALRALDAATPGFSARFDNAANATQAMLDLGVEQRRALADFQTDRAAEALAANGASSAATKAGIAQARGTVRDAYASAPGRFAVQVADKIAPTEVENTVGAMLKTGKAGATNMRSLVGSVAQDADALAGLRKAGTDWIVREFQNADGSVSGARMIEFVRDNRETLRELYPAQQMNMFMAVAHDIENNAKWRTETAIKGGSDSAKNVRPMLSEAAKANAHHTSMLVIAAEAMREGFDRGGYQGAALAGAGAATAYLVNTLRSAGIRSVADLYREALADPEKARMLISKMPDKPEGGKLRALTGMLRKELIVGPQTITAATPSGARR